MIWLFNFFPLPSFPESLRLWGVRYGTASHQGKKTKKKIHILQEKIILRCYWKSNVYFFESLSKTDEAKVKHTIQKRMPLKWYCKKNLHCTDCLKIYISPLFSLYFTDNIWLKNTVNSTWWTLRISTTWVSKTLPGILMVLVIWKGLEKMRFFIGLSRECLRRSRCES